MDPILRSKVEDNLIINYPDILNIFFRKILQLYKVIAAVLESYKDAELFQEGIS